MKTTPPFLQIFPAMFELYVNSIKVNQFYADLFARTFRQAVDIVSQQENARMKDNSLDEVWLNRVFAFSCVNHVYLPDSQQ